MRKAFATTRFTSEEVNGGSALLIWLGETLNSVIAYRIADGQIQAIHAVVNPWDKTHVYIQCYSARAQSD